jgi:hypothetical protein
VRARPALRESLLPCALLIGVFVGGTYWLNGATFGGPLSFDDAYIYLAAARTLTETGRLAVSPYHQTLIGITAPVYALLLAGGGRIMDPELFARILGLGAGAGAIACCFVLLRAVGGNLRHSAVLAFVPTLLLASSAAMWAHALTGMETLLVVALVLLSCLVYLRLGPGWASGLVAALLAVLRPEGLLLSAALVAQEGAGILGRDRGSRAGWASLGRFLCPTVVLIAAQALVFLACTGRLAASSIGARMLLYCWGTTGLAARLVAVGQSLVPLFHAAPFVGWLAVLGAMAAFVRPLAGPRAAAVVRALALLVVGYLAVFVHTGVDVSYQIGRYVMPLHASLVILSGVGLQQVARGGARRGRWAGVAAALGLALLLLPSLGAARDGWYALRPYHEMFLGVNAAYQETLAQLAAAVPAEARFAVTDVGQAAYRLPRQVFDLAGLVNPEMAAYFGTAARCVPPAERDLSDLPRRFAVDYIVIDAAYWNPFLGNLLAEGVVPVEGPPTPVYQVIHSGRPPS